MFLIAFRFHHLIEYFLYFFYRNRPSILILFSKKSSFSGLSNYMMILLKIPILVAENTKKNIKIEVFNKFLSFLIYHR